MATVAQLPAIIQGGMGVGVSSWQLARAVSRAGQLGVVSGTALDVVLARRLQDGDSGGDLRRALAHFPDLSMAQRVLDRYFLPEGRAAGRPYRRVPKVTLQQSREGLELTVVANFVEVWLAKEGHRGVVGINYLEKVQMATPAAALGAILAGVDVVLMGAGVPREIPRLLSDLAEGRVGGIGVDVHGADQAYRVEVDARDLLGVSLPRLRRPLFLAIVSAAILAAYLARDESTRPDGFVIEGPPAGGHNAPPRGLTIRTDPLASPTGFPFKIAQLTGTLSEQSVHDGRTRLCDLSYLRTPYRNEKGGIGYRCPSEPAHMYIRKGGDADVITWPAGN